MKKPLKFSLTLALVLTLVLVSTPGIANALILYPPIPVKPFAAEIAPGSWSWTAGVSGFEVQPDTLTTPAPPWRLIKTNGLVLSGPAYICHEFTGNQVGWFGDIYMLNGDSWVKLATTVEWVPTIEGHLMACAQAPGAGTYALFAYWVKPDNWQPSICLFASIAIQPSELIEICVLASDNCLCPDR